MLREVNLGDDLSLRRKNVARRRETAFAAGRPPARCFCRLSAAFWLSVGLVNPSIINAVLTRTAEAIFLSIFYLKFELCGGF